MPTTLEALHRAVVASPEDRTVRLACADALDEAGDAPRAEFIRSQIGAEAVPAADATHPARLRARRLFEAHWLEWWRPVAAAAGLPVPHVPSRRIRDRIARRVRSAVQENPRPANWPYALDPDAPAIQLADFGVSVRFSGGFPEEVVFNRFTTPEREPELVLHHLGDAMPLVRLSFGQTVTPAEWERVDGPHLARLPELQFNNLLPDTTMLAASSPYLAAVTRLSANPLATTPAAGNADAVRFLVQSPVWTDLRSLRFTGRLGPPAVRDLAERCTLERLEELDVRIGPPSGPEGMVLQAINEVFRYAVQAFTHLGTEPIPWAAFGPALEALAAAPWVRNLHRISITSGYLTGLLGVLSERLYGSAERAADLIPDAAVRALADAVDTPALERLTLPGALLAPSVREDLTTRLGPRVVFA
ncbi:TIGR02996 domain-containing protein [Gemmata sp.]|uniref:TIGR02996 domain-containing protein n=1 Tax=Gemmata sp. TaxID=1914242 RepID=UPI003F6F8692